MTVHELGHFTAAKLFKMPVKAFSIGLGPSIFKRKYKGTEYRLSVLPIGGYVQIAGEEDKDIPYGFLNQAMWKRFVVLIAGVTFNFIFAICTFFFLTSTFGNPVHGVEIVGAKEGTEAINYIKTGDQLLEVNGKQVSSDNINEISLWIKEIKSGEKAKISVLREEKVIHYTIPLTEIEGQEILGIAYQPRILFSKADIHKQNPIIAPFKEFTYGVESILKGLKMIVNGEVTIDDIQGPIGIVKTTGDISKTDLQLLIYWIALLNINLGVMNLLPIPSLDGGQIVFLAAEKVVGKKRWNVKIAIYINALFLLVLMCLILFISYHDILKLFR